MKVEGTKEFDAPVELVWDVLMDPERMAKLLPGVESFEVHDADHWSAAVKVPLGMGGLKLRFAFEQVEKRPTEYAKLNAKGQGVGAIVNMQTEFHLAPEASRTMMRWNADVRVAGPIGSMGQRVFQPIVSQQVTAVLDALEEQVAEAKAASLGGLHVHEPETAPRGPRASPENVPLRMPFAIFTTLGATEYAERAACTATPADLVRPGVNRWLRMPR